MRRSSIPGFAMLGFLFSLCSSLCSGSLLVNGDFALGLSGWSTSGSVVASADAAVLTDDAAVRAVLYQGVELLESGLYDLRFDFRNLLSAAAPLGSALDATFVSLYFSTTPGLFDPLSFVGFSGAESLLDVQVDGLVAHQGEVHALSPSPGFLRYETSFFLSTPLTLFVVFDLFDLNNLANDSVFVVDNVSLTLIPEPLLFVPAVGCLFLALVVWRRLKTKGRGTHAGDPAQP